MECVLKGILYTGLLVVCKHTDLNWPSELELHSECIKKAQINTPTLPNNPPNVKDSSSLLFASPAVPACVCEAQPPPPC